MATYKIDLSLEGEVLLKIPACPKGDRALVTVCLSHDLADLLGERWGQWRGQFGLPGFDLRQADIRRQPTHSVARNHIARLRVFIGGRLIANSAEHA